jgi:hypothetical protein
MIANLASLAVMIAALLFMLSIPFGKSEAGQSIRRAAAFAFVMAFVPAIVVCLLAPIVRTFRPPFGGVHSFLAICGALAILGVAALAAYGFLDIRGHARSRQPKPHGERGGFAKRRPSDQHHDASEQEEREG